MNFTKKKQFRSIIRVIIKKTSFSNILIGLFSFIFVWYIMGGLIEVILLVTKGDRATELKNSFKAEEKILKEHFKRASDHPYQFNDLKVNFKKEKHQKRIIILGDSFIFGDGVLYEEVWSRKLEKEFSGLGLEFLHWGRNGWSTLDQVEFLKSNYLEKKTIENTKIIILGVVDNDTDMKEYTLKPVSLEYYSFSSGISKLLPNFSYIIEEGLRNFFFSFPSFGFGYEAWLEKNYSEENLERYRNILIQLKSFIENRDAKLVAVLTPNSFDRKSKIRNKALYDCFKKCGILTINLFPKLEKKFSKMEFTEYSASEVNGHPGPILTSAYVESLKKERVIKELFESELGV